ncbi:MAG TPA: universal stress protein [Blastocatellia bacterium]|nr:universal stress protein [Blastocatellia bacterium]
MKLLLAVDSSAESNAVISEVEMRPWPPETEVCVLTVIDLFALTASVGYLEPFVKSENEAAKALVEQAAERLSRRGLQTTATAVEGYPGTTIVEEAEKWGADFVLVGSHGHTGFVRFLIGSIAKAVVQNATCSVEVVRRPRDDKEDAVSRSSGAMKILLATDGSDYSLSAARSVAERPWPDGSRVRIVSVVERVMPAADPWYAAGAVADRVRKENAKRSEDAVAAAQQIVASAGLKTETAVLDGTPKKRIVEDAREWNADLVAVGSHGRRGVTRYLLGSVSEAAALHAHCSVEVIRDRSLLGVVL